MTQLTSYLFFDGTCPEAMRFYECALGGKLEALIRYSEMPASEQMHGEGSDRIAHAYLAFDGGAIMASDFPPGQPAEEMSGFSMFLDVPTAAVDRYGTPWMISPGQTNT